MSKQKAALILAVTLTVSGALLAFTQMLTKTNQTITIWSWDYPDDLRFIKSEDNIQVAYYAGTIYLRHGRCFFKPRTKSLKINPQIPKYPAIRIESDGEPVSPGSVAAVIKTVLAKQGAKTIQLDFDATTSELPFYQTLLKTLPAHLDSDTTINITALTSWYTMDTTLAKLNARQKTAMCFSLGANASESLNALSRLKVKPDSIGVSVYEHQTNQYLKSLGLISQARSIYLYSAVPWQKETLQNVRAEVLCQ